MKKKLLLYVLLMIGLMSCNLDSKLSGNKGQKNNNDVKEFQIVFRKMLLIIYIVIKKSKKFLLKILENGNIRI